MSSKLIYKWLLGFLTKPLIIVKSIYYRLTKQHRNTTRLNICNSCGHKEHIKLGNICDLCGCFIDNKTRIDEEKCELNKW